MKNSKVFMILGIVLLCNGVLFGILSLTFDGGYFMGVSVGAIGSGLALISVHICKVKNDGTESDQST
ncbi:hypothetical protein [Marinimicrobium sp. ARAG 43.8]|uniref:hypothetical protein n=1 Tax=Marinimicrobium sp. ARAG 43.8 TaxID=3418719 RepID=UPI003CFAB4D4